METMYNPDLRFITDADDRPLCIVPHPLGGVAFQLPDSTKLFGRWTDVQAATAFATANGRTVRNLVPKSSADSAGDALPTHFAEKAFKLIRS